LLPYLTANVHFVVKREANALLVPNAALRWSPSSLAEVSPAARASTDPGADSVSSKQDKGPKERRGIIWLKDGAFVRPIEVKVGASDGTNTAVEADNLQEGQEVVIGESAVTSQSGTRNPFVPQIPRR
jgi:HlyD family secretion protein